VYAAIGDTEEEDAFYKKLEEIYDKTHKYDVRIILRDTNAKVGKEEVLRPITGPYPIPLTWMLDR
jgi:hypothetical protein